jgi:two-component system, LytTR family, response regulator AlgR
LRILIVDDEPPARERLRRLVSELGEGYEVAGEAADGEAALAFCAEQAVDTVLLDIRMPGLSGLQTAGRLAQLDPPPAVILVTAYAGYALAAFEHRVENYLVKPVRRERLHAALERVLVTTRPQRAAISAIPLHEPIRRRQLTAHYRGGLQAIPVEEVIYLRADRKYVTVRHGHGQMLLDESLKSLEEEFADLFVRVHRNALVSRRALAGLERAADGSVEVSLRGCQERLSVSRRHLPVVRRALCAGMLP